MERKQEQVAREGAALSIQRVRRGHVARMEVHMQQEVETAAAAKVQAITRGREAKRDLQAQKEATVKVQAAMRGKFTRQATTKLHDKGVEEAAAQATEAEADMTEADAASVVQLASRTMMAADSNMVGGGVRLTEAAEVDNVGAAIDVAMAGGGEVYGEADGKVGGAEAAAAELAEAAAAELAEAAAAELVEAASVLQMVTRSMLAGEDSAVDGTESAEAESADAEVAVDLAAELVASEPVSPEVDVVEAAAEKVVETAVAAAVVSITSGDGKEAVVPSAPPEAKI